MKLGLGEQLIPRTSDRLFSDFTTDERTILYDYVVSNTVKPEIGNDIGNLNDSCVYLQKCFIFHFLLSTLKLHFTF